MNGYGAEKEKYIGFLIQVISGKIKELKLVSKDLSRSSEKNLEKNVLIFIL